MELQYPSFKFKARDVTRMAQTVVRVVVYQGLGREYHAVTFDRLMTILSRFNKCDKIDRTGYRVLFEQLDGETDETGIWKIHTDFDDEIVKVR